MSIKITNSKLVQMNKKPNYNNLKDYSNYLKEKYDYVSTIELNRFVQHYYDEIVNSYNYLQTNYLSFDEYCLFCYQNSSEGHTKNYPKRLANSHLYRDFNYIDYSPSSISSISSLSSSVSLSLSSS